MIHTIYLYTVNFVAKGVHFLVLLLASQVELEQPLCFLETALPFFMFVRPGSDALSIWHYHSLLGQKLSTLEAICTLFAGETRRPGWQPWNQKIKKHFLYSVIFCISFSIDL